MHCIFAFAPMTHLLHKAIGAATVSCLLFGSYVAVRGQIVKESSMEGIQQLPPPPPLTEKCSTATPIPVIQSPIEKPELPPTKSAGRFQGLGEKNIKKALPKTVKAGDPVLHEPAQEVQPEEIGSDRIQKIIDDMVKVMRAARGVGFAAPQLGIPLKIIVLEDTEELIGYAPKEYTKALARQPFDLLVIINPNLLVKGNKSALFFEGCLSIDGFGAMVERFLEVEVTGLDRYGQPIKVVASGWQARILQHECDHLEGTLYVDKMIRKTFRTVENSQLPLASGCPKPGVREQFGQNY